MRFFLFPLICFVQLDVFNDSDWLRLGIGMKLLSGCDTGFHSLQE